jgi:hypothetical protein
MDPRPNPNINRLKRIAGSTIEIRLLAADREFLRDLARVNLLSGDHAAKYHYSHLKGGATRSLNRLEAAGLIESKTLRITGRSPVKTYQFSSRAMARAWGGSLPITGAKRNDLHELISSDLYFKLDRPQDFRLAADFSEADISAVGGCRPDALYTDTTTGELVVVEADSGHYTKNQILKKIAAWESVGLSRFVWGQPHYASARIPAINNISLYRF